jgi:hypothetical protein
VGPTTIHIHRLILSDPSSPPLVYLSSLCLVGARELHGVALRQARGSGRETDFSNGSSSPCCKSLTPYEERRKRKTLKQELLQRLMRIPSRIGYSSWLSSPSGGKEQGGAGMGGEGAVGRRRRRRTQWRRAHTIVSIARNVPRHISLLSCPVPALPLVRRIGVLATSRWRVSPESGQRRPPSGVCISNRGGSRVEMATRAGRQR